MITFLACWFLLSIPASIAFCWLLRTGRIGFAPVVERNEFSANWLEHRP